MGLQVRLRHTLGERLLDLPDRPVDQPLIVGRAREADLKVPSVSVAPEHCALFVHEGQWVLQDMSDGATFVNGSALEGPTPLCVGDVIVLGADASPAYIEVDPAGAGQGNTGQPALTQEPAPPPVRARATAGVPRQHMAQPPRLATARGAPAAPRPLAAPVAPPPDDPWGTSPAAENDPFADWQQPAAADSGPAAPVRRKKPKKSSDAGLYIGIFACVVIIGGTAFIAYQRMNPPPPPPAPAPVMKNTPAHHDSIFYDSSDSTPPAHAAPPSAKTAVASREPVEAPAPPPPPSDSAPPPPPPPAAENDAPKDAGWEEVQGALVLQNYTDVIIKADDYRRNHAGASAKSIDAVIDQAMDGIWWKRIKMLCDKKESLLKQVRAKDKDIREETNAKFKQTLVDEKKPLEQEIKRTDDNLSSVMGYTTAQTPDPTDKEMIAKLTSDRDATKFGEWRVSTLRFIRSNHGKTPWDGE